MFNVTKCPRWTLPEVLLNEDRNGQWEFTLIKNPFSFRIKINVCSLCFPRFMFLLKVACIGGFKGAQETPLIWLKLFMQFYVKLESIPVGCVLPAFLVLVGCLPNPRVGRPPLPYRPPLLDIQTPRMQIPCRTVGRPPGCRSPCSQPPDADPSGCKFFLEAEPLDAGHVTCDACWDITTLPPRTDEHL